MEGVEHTGPTNPNMSRLLDCSHEVLHSILTSVDPSDLAALSLSCQSLHTFIQDNLILHKELYLQRYVEAHIISAIVLH